MVRVRKLGESIQQEWDADPCRQELWNALQLFDNAPHAAIAALTGLAAQGSGLAMMYLGEAYLKGRGGIESDRMLGEQWLVRSAEHGSIEGRYGLAIHYEGSGRPESARNELTKLADRGYSPAMFRLGYGFYKGKWGGKDIAQAQHFLGMAQRAGHLPGAIWLNRIDIVESLGLARKVSGIWGWLKLAPLVFRYVSNYPTSDRLRTESAELADLIKDWSEGE